MQFNLKQTRTEREIRNQTYTQIDRWEMQFKTDRQTDMHTHTLTDWKSNIHTNTQTGRECSLDRHTHTPTHTHTNRKSSWPTNKQAARQTEEE